MTDTATLKRIEPLVAWVRAHQAAVISSVASIFIFSVTAGVTWGKTWGSVSDRLTRIETSQQEFKAAQDELGKKLDELRKRDTDMAVFNTQLLGIQQQLQNLNRWKDNVTEAADMRIPRRRKFKVEP